MKQHLTVSKTPKLFKAAVRELDAVLDDTKDMLCLQNLADVFFAQVVTKGDWEMIDQQLTMLLEQYNSAKVKDQFLQVIPETPMKLFKAYERVCPDDLERFKLLQ
jgi:hypothetical protein